MSTTTEQLSPLDLAWLAFLNRPEDPGLCRICGAELAIGKAGGGEPTVYHCSTARPLAPGQTEDEREAAWEHFRDSEVVQRRHGDSHVVAVIDELRARRAAAGEPAYPEVGELYNPWGISGSKVRQRYEGDDRFETVLLDDED